MFELGLVEEVKQFDPNFTSQQAIGYKEVHQYLNNEIDLNTCIDLVQQNLEIMQKDKLHGSVR